MSEFPGDFRFSSDRFAHVSGTCCGKAGCTNTTEQCVLRKAHQRELDKDLEAADGTDYPHPTR